MRARVFLVLVSCATPLAQGPFDSQQRSALVLTCVPPDAEVVLDGVAQGTCNDFDGKHGTLSLGGRRRVVEVRKPHFRSWSTELEADHTRVTMSVTLLPVEP